MRVREGNKEKDILEAAVMVFAESGYHSSKISKIADRAGVATGSVYVYFKNKESILLRIFEELWGQLHIELQKLVDNPQLTPTEKIDAMIDLVFDLFIENPSLAIVFVNEQNHLLRGTQMTFLSHYEKFLDLGEEIIRQGTEAGLFSASIDLPIFRVFIFGAIRNLLHQWAHEPHKYQLNKIRQNVKYLTRHGIQI